MAAKTKKKANPLTISGRNATGQLIEACIPAGKLPLENPGKVIQQLLAKHKNIEPTPALPE